MLNATQNFVSWFIGASIEVSTEAPMEVLGMFFSIIAILAQDKISKQRLTVSTIYFNPHLDSAG